MTLKPAIKTVILLLICSAISSGQAPPELQEKLNTQIKQLKQYSIDAQILAAVKTYNSNPPAEGKALTNDKWHSLSILDPFVRGIGKNAISQYLKSVRGELQLGNTVTLARSSKQEQFSVTWVRKENNGPTRQIGVVACDHNSLFWDDALRELSGSRTDGRSGYDSQPPRPKAMAQGA